MRTGVVALLALAWIAQVAARNLPVPADKGWKHARTGLVLRATLLGLPRTRLIDNRNDERDVIAQFNDPAIDTSATVYIFEPAERSVPIWFDRAEYALVHRESTGGAVPAADAVPFAPPRATVAAGLRRVYTPRKLPNRSDGLALLPLGNWLVVIRLTSTRDDPAALDTRLTQLIGELGWPADAAAPTQTARPVEPCTTKLHTRHATLNKPTMVQALLGGALMASAAKQAKTDASPAPAADDKPWCRDGEGTATYGVYRYGEATDAYLIALTDAGRIVSIDSAAAIPGLTPAGSTPTLHDLGGESSVYPSFDALPDPKQVMDLVTHGAPLTRVSGDGGKQITIDGRLPAK